MLHQYVHRVFWRLLREIGLRRQVIVPATRARLRHRFATRTLLDCYREGKDVEQQLPVISTYLRHACVRDTYRYQSTCPRCAVSIGNRR
ncbi:hypothetical protein [Bradyrhizobium sp. USDA 336]|uniref:hypothetical protein n=1 Tax=Bradyrhizobium sp. USDA 336 TaxID=3156311 RepID=UPI00383460AB